MERTLPMRNIGVTGIMSVEEMKSAQSLFLNLFIEREACKKGNSEPRLMAGILVSSKTINGIPNRYPGRYPKPEALFDLFNEAAAWTLPLCHYNTDTPKNLIEECEKVIEVVGEPPIMPGFQLNVRWPDPAQLRELKLRHPKLHILLQIGAKAIGDVTLGGWEGEPMSYDLPAFAARVAQYEGIVDEVLLDPSGGKGQPLDAKLLEPLVLGLMKLNCLGIGVAGGLSAETMDLVSDLVPVCPYLSIDAEGRLRNPDDDSLDMEKAAAYLRAAFDLFYPKGGAS